MNTLAGLTGGRAFYNTNGIEDSIQKATEDAEVTFTLGFSPSDDSFDDKFHKLTVKVDRKGVDVRFRKGYYAFRQQPKGEENTEEAAKQLLRSPLDATAVGIVASAKPDPKQPGHIEARVIVDIRTLQLERHDGLSAGAVDIALFVEGTKSVRTLTRKFEIPDNQLAAALESGLDVTDSLDAGPQAGDLRVVVQDRATGAAGSVRLSLKSK